MLPKVLRPDHEVDASNPLFIKATRHLRELSDRPSLKQYTHSTLIGLPLFVFGWWLVEIRYLNPSLRLSRFEGIAGHLLIAAALVMLISSLYAIPSVIGALTSRVNSPYWDALRLTSQSPTAILQAEDAIAQFRLWRLTVLEMALRISIIMWFSFTQFYRTYVTRGDFVELVAEVLHPFRWGFWIMFTLTCAAFLLEPILRTRLIIALHIAIVARFKQLALAGLVGIFAVILVHAAEVLAAFITFRIIESLSKDPIELFIIICITPLTLLMLGISLLIYRITRTAAFNIATDYAFRQD